MGDIELEHRGPSVSGSAVCRAQAARFTRSIEGLKDKHSTGACWPDMYGAKVSDYIHGSLGVRTNPLRTWEEVHTGLHKMSQEELILLLAVTFLLFSTCQKDFNNPNFVKSRGGINVVSASLWKDNSLLVRSVRAELGFWSPPKPPLSKFPSTLPRQDPTPTPLWMEADISTQSAQSSIEKNTVPCIPAGPKSCLVRKMAWSWYSECSGSRRCCVLAHRHTCSRLRDGLPRSIRLMD